jgi:catechol 2,3-dioxygenase-like lactoylglutathione lyase family enzyme
MPLTELNHYFVRARDLERSRRFYCDVLGFEVMPRPDFGFPGYWLGVGGKIQVHMGQHGIPNSGSFYMGTKSTSATDNAGVVDHVAFTATAPEEFAKRLEAMGVPARKRWRPEIKLFQVFIEDPDGLTIELNFQGVDQDPT